MGFVVGSIFWFPYTHAPSDSWLLEGEGSQINGICNSMINDKVVLVLSHKDDE